MTYIYYIIASLLISIIARRIITLSAIYKKKYYEIVGDFYYWRFVVDENGHFTCDKESSEYVEDSDDGLAPVVKYGYFIPFFNILVLAVSIISYSTWLSLYLCLKIKNIRIFGINSKPILIWIKKVYRKFIGKK